MVAKCLPILSLIATLGSVPALHAQQSNTPVLVDILQRLESNLNHYDSSVPSFFCDEHIVSSQQGPGMQDEKTIIESIFRLKRVRGPHHITTLEESRDITQVDGKPVTRQEVQVPTLLDGAFEGGLAVVSASQTVCMNYNLQTDHKKRSDALYVIRFATVLTPQNSGDCLLQENTRGLALIDPTSMQITRLELSTPHHTIIPGDASHRTVTGQRVITVDYAPVSLGKETFWMPSQITLQATSGAKTFHREIWSFSAIYRDYHKLETSSHIISGSEIFEP